MRRRTRAILSVMTLLMVVVPTVSWATHEVSDERPLTTFEDFRAEVASWIDPWLDNSESDLADDRAPLVAISLYEELLSIRPAPCYWDAYAAYWAVAADLRALGQAPNREQQLAEIERIYEDVARADALAELNAVACATPGNEVDDTADVETSPPAR